MRWPRLQLEGRSKTRRRRYGSSSLLLAGALFLACSGQAGAGEREHPLLSRALFDKAFAERLAFYDYDSLLRALDVFPAAFSTGPEEVRRREVAAFLAQVSHETGGLRLIREENQQAWDDYCDPTWIACMPDRLYFGRGPIQLSWNYNYAAAGEALGQDLLSNPELIERDATLAFKTAVWFWMTQTGAGSTTSHNAMVSGAGFAETTRSINGTLECDQPEGSIGYERMMHRAKHFTRFSLMLEVSTEGNILC